MRVSTILEQRVRNAKFCRVRKLVRSAEVFSGTDGLFAEENMHEVKNQFGLVYKV
jgi:hypothetical protein